MCRTDKLFIIKVQLSLGGLPSVANPNGMCYPGGNIPIRAPVLPPVYTRLRLPDVEQLSTLWGDFGPEMFQFVTTICWPGTLHRPDGGHDVFYSKVNIETDGLFQGGVLSPLLFSPSRHR